MTTTTTTSTQESEISPKSEEFHNVENPLPSTDEEDSETDLKCEAIEEQEQEGSNHRRCSRIQQAAAALATEDGNLLEMKEAQLGFLIQQRADSKTQEQVEDCETATTTVARAPAVASAAQARQESAKAQQQQEQRKARTSIQHVPQPVGLERAVSAVGAFSVSPEEHPTPMPPRPAHFTSSVGAVGMDTSDNNNNNSNSNNNSGERENSLQRLLITGVELVEAELVEDQPDRQQGNSQHTDSASDQETGSVIAPKFASLIVEAVAAPHWGFCLIALFTLILLGMGVLMIVVVLLTIQGKLGKEASSTNDQTALVFPRVGQTMIGTAAFDKFGGPLTLSSDGMMVAIGARGNSDMGPNTGVVRVYKLQDGREQENCLWTSMGGAVSGMHDGDHFAFSGMAMSSDGSRIAAGAPFHSCTDPQGELMVNSGHVRVFDFNSSTYSWSQAGPNLNGLGEGHWFGRDVTLSANGKIIAASSYQSSENGNFSGHIRVFQETRNEENAVVVWKQMGSTLLGEAPYDRLGRSMAMSTDGTILAAGAIQFKDMESVVGKGYVKVFRYNSYKEDWDVLGQPLLGDNDHDLFGRHVSISSDGTIVACGGHFGDDNGKDSGYVRIYQLVENEGQPRWYQLGQTLRGSDAEDRFGLAVSLSATGHRVAIGADQYMSNSSGYVRIFDFDHDDQHWIQWGDDIVGDSPRERFGGYLKLSANANILAVGAVASNANGDDSGEVQVFNVTQPVPRSSGKKGNVRRHRTLLR